MVSDSVRPTVNIAELFPVITPNLVGISLFNLDDRRSPYLQQWTFSSQHTIQDEIFLEFAYVGSKGTKLSKRMDMNTAPNPPAPDDTRPVQQRRRYPNYSFILNDTGNVNSSYNALQVTFRKSFRNGLNILSGYTWSEAISPKISASNSAARLSTLSILLILEGQPTVLSRPCSDVQPQLSTAASYKWRRSWCGNA